jgi:ParB family chromosome partitioning protein
VASVKKGGLGRGLGALIPQKADLAPSLTDVAQTDDRILYLDPRDIEPNPHQPRVVFNEESLEELAGSIRRDGVQEPVLVRKVGSKFQLISGERRVRASVLADADTVPAICRDISDSEMLRLGLIENIQREDLNAIEEARAYQKLVSTFSWTQEELSRQVGKKRATVANALRLLNLPAEIQQAIADETISMGHARALLAIDTPSLQRSLFKKTVEDGLSVRQIEQLAAQTSTNKRKAPPKTPTAKDPNITALEDDLRKRLGTRVSVHPSGPSKGKLEIEYYSLDDLDRILEIIRG